ncbi:HD domain-containing protein [Bariatricus sp. SGI.161]|uniref:HD domain-containing protein n=1 Tax=Bariatricus sp. SGI.161 TaxID=3420550 RepID=UPI002A8F8DD2|nr:HD domain-containing protein [Lachnospiraceae bacterium]MDY4206359.1 HD domain-containing protein [Lachnospiraceae bacterium]
MSVNRRKLQVLQLAEKLEGESRLGMERRYYQHGVTTIFQHSINVACVSCKIAEKYHLDVDYYALIRGALLHDYFLYDWHVKDRSHRFHGFTHPRRALENADKEFQLTETERNMIYCHMFPLTPIPPSTQEAWIVCVADKICALSETMMPLLCRLKVYKTL